jgi:hypothetical protein
MLDDLISDASAVLDGLPDLSDALARPELGYVAVSSTRSGSRSQSIRTPLKYTGRRSFRAPSQSPRP